MLGGDGKGVGGKREVGIRNKYKKTFGGYGYVQYVDCDDGFSYAKTSNCTTYVLLTICLLYLSKTITNK